MVEDPLEAKIADALDRHNITYKRDVFVGGGPNGRMLDFYLPEFGLYIEVKAFPCERMYRQVAGMTNILAVIGKQGVDAFGALLDAIACRSL